MPYEPYAPLNQLKPLAENIWIVDGPVVDMNYMGLFHLPFPTRMTVIRLADRRLVLHSPTELSDDLVGEIWELGEVAYLVSPNRIHYVHLNDWAKAFPNAQVWAAPGMRDQQPGVTVGHIFEQDGFPDWGDEIECFVIHGGYMAEVEFFHRPSRSLILTDLIENFEEQRVEGAALKLAMRCGGVMAPVGSLPRDLRLTFAGRYRAGLEAAVTAMVARAPERVIIAHGQGFDQAATERLRQSFDWLLSA